MTKKQLADLLLEDFYGNFAAKTANIVVGNDAVEPLYELAVNGYDLGLPASEKDKLIFRAAYILETIYKVYPDYFWPYGKRFFKDFPKAGNGSAKRHYCNIMADLLDHEMPDAKTSNIIAEACTEWISDPKVKVAVKIKGTEILLKLMRKTEWVKEALPIILEDVVTEPQPAMAAAIRRWKRKGWLAEVYE